MWPIQRIILDARRSQADAIGQPEARKVIAKTVATNLAHMARRHKTVVKTGEREAARRSLA
jgi:hypothetical protein